MSVQATIAACATPHAPAPRALIRLSGPAVPHLAATLLDPPPPAARAAWRSVLTLDSVALPVLALRYAAPASYTGEDVLELLVPGNPLIVERVLQALCAAGEIRRAEPGEFTARAYLSGRLTLEQAEGVGALIAARSEAQAGAARSLLDGSFGASVRAWREEVASLLALVEAGIDFSDQEDVRAISDEALDRRLDVLLAPGNSESLGAVLEAASPIEQELGMPRVVLAGAPNAGKSSLFNALLGRARAVASPTPGATRDVLVEPLDLSAWGGMTVLLADVAGVDGSVPGGVAEQQARSLAMDAIRGADLVIWCDPRGKFTPGEIDHPNALRVRTQADRLCKDRAPGAIAVCALDGRGLDDLRHAVSERLDRSRGAERGTLLGRHAESLRAAAESLRAARREVKSGSERVAHELRGALDALGTLCGHVTPDDVLGRVFSSFCIGK